LDRFRERSIQLLVATDVAARGIDVDNITHVINYNLPDDIENYTHRSGRTARAGRQGKSLVLINARENYKIKAIERQIRMTFAAALIPEASEICGIQLNKLISKVKEIEVKENDIAPFLPAIMADFEELSKEEVIKKFISAEFNRFIEYYDRAGDLNVAGGREDRGDRGRDKNDRFDRKDRFERSDRGERGDRGDRSDRAPRDMGNRTRFFVSLGKRDGLNPGGLLRVICDATGIKSASVGRIDVMPNFSFFEADKGDEGAILSQVNGADYEGHKVMVEITQKKAEGGERRSGGGGERRSFGGGERRSFGGDRERSGGGDRDRSGGDRRSGGGGFRSEGGASRGGFGGARREGGSDRRSSGGGERRSSSSTGRRFSSDSYK
jgi:ATP-dependent RNA helicase DeaD